MTETALLPMVAVGLAATLGMDLWNLFLKRAFGLRPLDYCLLGRWLAHMPRGTFRHASIASAAPMPSECLLGWVAHYSIGVSLALGLALLFPDWTTHPTLAPALGYGVATVGMPLFVMQPALGLGIASSKTPHPAQARLKSLGTHTVFGLGLYLAGLAFL
jgi:hypothetical protein